MDVVEKIVSPLVESQFPAFYRESGPVFVEFVREYYAWAQSVSPAINALQSPRSTVTVRAGSATVEGSNTRFTEALAPGAGVGIFYNSNDYFEYAVASIANDSSLELATPVGFSATGTAWANLAPTRGHLYDSRRFLEYKDVDETLDDFLVYFKNKYLVGLQFETDASIRQLVKHSLDLYRAKGTERAVELLFKIVFGAPVEVYYPSTDVFRLSDGVWKRPTYLEVALSESSALYSGKEVLGLTSGATAYVDRVVRRSAGGVLTDVMYVSARVGDFATHEAVVTTDGTVGPRDAVTVVGSLNAVEVPFTGTGSDFAVGDLVTLSSATGFGAVGRVSAVANQSGVVDFQLTDGGWGYSNAASAWVSTTTLAISNVVPATADCNSVYDFRASVTQPYGILVYHPATDPFPVGATLSAYDSSDVLVANGLVCDSASLNATHWSVTVAMTDGAAGFGGATHAGTPANVLTGTATSWTNATATGSIVGLGPTENLTVVGADPAVLEPARTLVQYHESGAIRGIYAVSAARSFGPNAYSLKCSRSVGLLVPGSDLFDLETGARAATLSAIGGVLGLVAATGTFTYAPGNVLLTDSVSGATATVTRVDGGAGASFAVTGLDYTETVDYSADEIHPYLGVEVGAASYGFPTLPSANANTTIYASLDHASVTVGRIATLGQINPGSDYAYSPVVRVVDASQVWRRDVRSAALSVSGATQGFVPGDVVFQATGSRGFVTAANDSVVVVERGSLAHDFVPTSNSTTYLQSEAGAVASLDAIADVGSSEPAGLNAVVADSLSMGNGSIVGLEVVDSGFRFADGDVVFVAAAGGRSATGVGRVRTQGAARGFYEQKGGFVSDQKKLVDWWYYQPFSYDVLSSVTLNKYADMLREVVHLAGTKLFGTYVVDSRSDVVPTSPTSVLTTAS